ncbi:deoxyribose-phosphate aldolase [Aquimarina sp. ERC-38]|uniref:DUF6503 family protein n=1 Tax=Aquimarina sp. ERC-38 TaxID=2949996 RepID=UPI0022482BE5|nr:DUF6503 family protein [Aquimarina sp. ERC-38]UZO80811.1 deoxyribose-phosphate aldolase [Aquimarina sp. ERC-38]
MKKIKKIVQIVYLILIILGITNTLNAQVSADKIIDKAIEKAGGALFDKATIQFTFRGNQYQSWRNLGAYRLERTVIKPEGLLQDIVSNNGLERYLDHCPQLVTDSLLTRISDGVNSVHYFASLPFGLNAPAVNKKLIGEGTIKYQPYYKVEVTFIQEGGGTDFEDVFLYWIHKENFTIDYLAYQYAVNGGGIRFREAFNPRVIKGIRFVDYKNYKTDDLSISLHQLDKLYEAGKLKLLSEINTENIRVFFEQDCC